MRSFKLIYIVFALMAMASCSKNGADSRSAAGNIRLGVAVGDIQIDSRAATIADPYLGSTPSALNPFRTAVWFRTEGGVYDHAPAVPTYLPAHTELEFIDSQLKYVYCDANNLQYPTDNSTVYCIGLYPNDGGWATSVDDKSILHPIDGRADLMLAGENAGTWNSNFEPLRYEHLLTWIKITVCATSHDTAEAWGAIEQITINSDSDVKVDWASGACVYEGAQTIYTMDANNPVGLDTTMQEVASVFCSPEKKYTLRIKTTNNPDEKEIPLQLYSVDSEGVLAEIADESQARGKCFVLSLYFKPYNVIEGVCALNAWNNQNEDIYLTAE